MMLLGIRIICNYIDDVYEVVGMLKNFRDLKVITEKDYIKNPKPSGYRSLHVLAKYQAETVDGVMPINVEFQIRTHAMHLWASIEHSLKYKYYQEIPQTIKERLVDAAVVSAQLDEEMSKIHQAVLETKDQKTRGYERIDDDDDAEYFLSDYK